MAVGHAFQHVLEVDERLDVVELGGGDEGTDGGPADAAAIRAGEQVVLAAKRYCPFILPMSGRKLEVHYRWHP
jgi:hypothetical protein